MPERLIVNTSPLIFLSRVDGLGWVTHLCRNTVLVPKAVVTELLEGLDGVSIMDTVNNNKRFTVIDDAIVPAVISAWDLGAGETQVLSSCLTQTGAVAVLDDRAARQCGMSLGIPVVGTLGLVLALKRSGLISIARPIIEQLLFEGLYLDSSLVREALKEVDE